MCYRAKSKMGTTVDNAHFQVHMYSSVESELFLGSLDDCAHE